MPVGTTFSESFGSGEWDCLSRNPKSHDDPECGIARRRAFSIFSNWAASRWRVMVRIGERSNVLRAESVMRPFARRYPDFGVNMPKSGWVVVLLEATTISIHMYRICQAFSSDEIRKKSDAKWPVANLNPPVGIRTVAIVIKM